jgi:hypothetical protein
MQQMDSSVNVSKTSNQIGSMTSSIGITESLVSPTDQNFVVKLLNNSGSTITVSNVKIGDSNVNFSEDLAQGGSKLFKVRTDNNCELGKVVSEDVTITYVTVEGLTKTESLNDSVMFDCSPYNIAQANLANQCPTCTSVPTLVWADADELGPLNWQEANDACVAKTTGGYTWRLPTAAELSRGFIEQFLLSSPINRNLQTFAWSSDETDGGVNALVVTFGSNFNGNYVSVYKGGKAGASAHVRCVR